MAELLENIGHNVRRLREERGWNQTELGFHADTSPSIISLIENGKRNPSTVTLAKIAGALGVEVVDLFPKAESRSSLEPSLNDLLEEERRARVEGEPLARAHDVFDVRNWVTELLWNGKSGFRQLCVVALHDGTYEIYGYRR